MTNHPKDRHILAAAVAAGAQTIVTNNLRHFPRKALAPLDIVAQTPNQFLTDLFYENPDLVFEAIRQQSANTRRPHLTVEAILSNLAKMRCRQFSDLVQQHFVDTVLGKLAE